MKCLGLALVLHFRFASVSSRFLEADSQCVERHQSTGSIYLQRGYYSRRDASLRSSVKSRNALSNGSITIPDDFKSSLFSLLRNTTTFPEVVRSHINMHALIHNDREEREKYAAMLTAMLLREPPAEIKISRRPYEINVSCTGFFDGYRESPARIVDLIVFGFELDALEWRFYELNEFIDTFVILESPTAHHMFRKPMLFASSWARFADFANKTVYLNDDDSEVLPLYNESVTNGHDWRMEERMRELVWKRYIASQGGMTNVDLQNTIFLHGDPDEIPSAAAIAHFKLCKPRVTPLNARLKITLWRQNFEHAGIVPDSNGEDWCNAAVYQATDTDQVARRSGSPQQLYTQHQSAHVNRVAGVYANLFKDLTMSEGGVFSSHKQISKEHIAEDPEICRLWQDQGIRTCCEKDDQYLRSLRKDDYIPWLAKYNPQHYPYAFPSRVL